MTHPTRHDSPAVYADLHTHTSCSDGQLSPRKLVAEVEDRSIAVLAITDHDTLDALEEARQAAEGSGLVVVPGVELSVTLDGTELHVLAYYIDSSHSGLQDHLSSMRQARRDRAWRIVDCLQGHGISLNDDELEDELSSTSAPGRPHVADALIRGGHVASREEAFERYLGADGPAFVPKPDFPVAEALDLIHAAGGVGVLAHPGHWTSLRQIRALTDQGLDGIEVRHPSHSRSLRRYYERVARDFGVLATGGSDFHGASDHHLGAVGLSEYEWERFRDAVA